MKNHYSSASVLWRWSSGAVLAASMLWFTPASAQTGLGLALSFDGVDDYVSVTPGSALDWTNGTIEFWMNPRTLAGNACLLASGGPTGVQTRYRLHLSTNALGLWNGSSFQTVPFAGTAGQRCHVAVVLSPTNAQFFVNGLPLGATTNGINLGVTGAPFTLGAAYNDSGNLSNYFAGMLDEVRVWNVARSPADITNHMFQPVTAAEPGLVAHWKFDEAAGVMAYDVTANHLHGTLVKRPVRVVSYWRPVITLKGLEALTNECHVPFVDPGAFATASPVAITAGADHNLALKADGTVVGWGYNNIGQTTVPANATGMVAITAGAYHSLALKNDGSIAGWGWNLYNQLAIPASASNVVAIAAGDLHSLALKADGTVVGWGSSAAGQTSIPNSATNVVAIAARWDHSMALKADGSVVSWGADGSGQPTGPPDATNVVAIAAGGFYSLALRADGTVIGWGKNDDGQTTIPAIATNVVAIAAGAYHSLALKADGTVIGWGRSDSGQAAIPLSATNVVAIAAGDHHSLALKADGTVVGWGWNAYGQSSIPASVTAFDAAISVSGILDVNTPGGYELKYSVTSKLGAVGTTIRRVVVRDTRPPAIALLGYNPLIQALGDPFVDPGATATDECMGDLTVDILVEGQVDPNVPGYYLLTYTVTDSSGNSTEANRTVAVGFPVAITLPASHLLNDAATLNGTVDPNGVSTTAWFEWGTTRYDQCSLPRVLGTGTSPKAISSELTGLLPGVVYHYRVVASNSVGVATGTDQSFWSPALNLNSSNPLTNECHLPFVDLTTVNAFPLAIAAGGYHNQALRRDGTVVAWGSNDRGQTNSPASATNVVAVAAGGYHSLALLTNGTVVAWGYNYNGQTTVPASATNVVAIAAGGYHSLGLRTDGTVVGWGRNNFGQSAIPARATSVVAIAAGDCHSLVLRTNGTVVAWGYDYDRQATVPASATNVVAIAAGFNHSLALRSNGTVVAWGYNGSGQTIVPPSATNVAAIAAGGYHNLALRSNGTVVAWGSNANGQTNTPAAATNVVAIAAGSYHSLALKEDGTVVGWGWNAYGQSSIPASVYQLNLSPVSGTVDANTPGVYELTYSITNALGAVGTAARTVVVTDTRPPVLTLRGANPLLHARGTPFTDPGATATDLCAGDLTGSIVITNTVNFSLPGSYTNTYTVTDASGNTAQTNRVVTVVYSPQTVFGGCSVPAPGQFRLQATGTAGLTYTLQTTTNLVNWVNHTNVVAGPGGLIDCLMDIGMSAPAGFYRLSWP